MDVTLVAALLAARQSATRETMSLSMVRQQHLMDLSLVDMLTQAIKAAPQPGQGNFVDKSV